MGGLIGVGVFGGGFGESEKAESLKPSAFICSAHFLTVVFPPLLILRGIRNYSSLIPHPSPFIFPRRGIF